MCDKSSETSGEEDVPECVARDEDRDEDELRAEYEAKERIANELTNDCLVLENEIKRVEELYKKLFLDNLCQMNGMKNAVNLGLNEMLDKMHNKVIAKSNAKRFTRPKPTASVGCDVRPVAKDASNATDVVKTEDVVTGCDVSIGFVDNINSLATNVTKESIDFDNSFYKCDYNECQEIFVTSADMCRHKLSVHRLNDGLTRGVKRGADFDETQSHSSKMSSSLTNEELIAKYIKAKNRCGYDGCGKRFDRRDRLKEHIRRHLNLKEFECDDNDCDYRSVALSALKRHVKRVHSKDKSVKQPVLVASERSVKDYVRAGNHTKTVHSKDKSVKQPALGVSERSAKDYVRAGNRCGYDECGKHFGHRSHLLKHIRRHLNQRPFKCTYDGCDYSGLDPSSVKRHVQSIHLKIRPFKCQNCGKDFIRKDSLRKHEKSTHEKTVVE